MKAKITSGTSYTLIRLGKIKIYITTYKMRPHKKGGWKARLRAAKMEEQEGKCPRCGNDLTGANSSIHHIKPVSLFPELKKDPDNIQLLCDSCHKSIHKEAQRRANQIVYSSHSEFSNEIQ